MLNTELPRNKGFTLIEVLVSMVIMAIGLLGLAGLQTLSIKDNQDAYLSSQATALAYEMSDRIRANAAYWKGPVPTPSCPASNLCNNAANPCNAANMANFDYCYWKESVEKKLVAGATAAVSVSGTTTGAICSGGGDARCLTIQWTGSGANKTYSQYQLEVRP